MFVTMMAMNSSTLPWAESVPLPLGFQPRILPLIRRSE